MKERPTIHILVPKDEIGQGWIDENIGSEATPWAGGIVIEHKFIETIRTAIEDDGLKKHFTLDDVGR